MKSILTKLEKQFPFFEKELIAEMQEHCNAQNINTGDEILGEGRYIESYPIVLEGSICAVRKDSEGRELLLYFVNPGEACSMVLARCIDKEKSNVSVYAAQPSTIIQVPANLPDQWIVKYPSWRTYIMHSFQKRFDELLDTIDAIAFLELDEKLTHFFLGRFKATGETVFKGRQQDLAVHLNSSPEVVSRLLKQMETKGLIILNQEEIDYTSVTKLLG